ncbi:unnamed protein product [Calicophoron daubneyi]|uniref:adenylate cyclase n=1 Tax=Calicophoron daubneyi TaxID=300641 RepID=A0AAV2TZK3_CALDB
MSRTSGSRFVRSRIFRQTLRDNLTRPSDFVYAIVDKISQIYTDVNSILSFHSAVLESYLKAASIQDTRRNVRSSLKLLFFITWAALYTDTLRKGKFEISDMYSIVTVFTVFFLLYFYTFNEYGHMLYSWLSYGIITFVLLFATTVVSLTIVQWTLVIPYVKLLICLIIFLPIRLDLTLALIVMFSLAVETLAGHQRGFRPFECDKVNVSGFGNVAEEHNHPRRPGCADSLIHILMIALLLISGTHIQFWNKMRRRAAFIYIGHTVHLQKRNHKAKSLQDDVIEAVMPMHVWRRYWGISGVRSEFANQYYYQKRHTDLAFLAAGIINLDELEDFYSLSEFCGKLTQLIDSFDRLAVENNCERLHVNVADFLYTSGVSKKRGNLTRFCIETGLGMVEIVKRVSQEWKVTINIKIGIHVGQGIVVAYGGDRVRYDILSSELSIVKLVMDSCIPGEVTISLAANRRIIMLYPTQPATVVNYSQKRVIHGRELTVELQMPTYKVVGPSENDVGLSHSGDLSTRISIVARCVEYLGQSYATESKAPSLVFHGETGNRHVACTAKNTARKSVFSFSRKLETSAKSLDVAPTIWNVDQKEVVDPVKLHQIDAEVLHLVTDLRSDPKRTVSLMQYLPIRKWTKLFREEEIEWHYQNHTRDVSYPVYVDSLKLGPAVDGVIVALSSGAAFFYAFVINEDYEVALKMYSFYTIELTCLFVLLGCLIWTSTKFSRFVSPRILRFIHEYLSHQMVIRGCLLILTLLPSIHAALFLLMKYPLSENDTHAFDIIAVIWMSAIINHMSATTLPVWLNFTGALITTVIFSVIKHLVIRPPETDVSPQIQLHEAEITIVSQFFDLYLSIIMVWFMSNVNDHNCRLNFYCMRELRICREEQEQLYEKLRKGFKYLFPDFIARQLYKDNAEGIPISAKNLAKSVNNAGIAVIYLSNLYTLHAYQPPAESEKIVQILNLIFATIDDLLSRSSFFGITNLQVANDHCLLASGLDQLSEWDAEELFHVGALVDYCLAVQRKVKDISEQYLDPGTPITLQIGVSKGSVRTAVVGTHKPTFVIWGRPLSTAMKIAHICPPGEVQVTSGCKHTLGDRYSVTPATEVQMDSEVLQTFLVRTL